MVRIVVVDYPSVQYIAALIVRLCLDQLVHVVAYTLVVIIVDSQEYAIAVELVSADGAISSLELDVALSLVVKAVNSSLSSYDVASTRLYRDVLAIQSVDQDVAGLVSLAGHSVGAIVNAIVVNGNVLGAVPDVKCGALVSGAIRVLGGGVRSSSQVAVVVVRAHASVLSRSLDSSNLNVADAVLFLGAVNNRAHVFLVPVVNSLARQNLNFDVLAAVLVIDSEDYSVISNGLAIDAVVGSDRRSRTNSLVTSLVVGCIKNLQLVVAVALYRVGEQLANFRGGQLVGGSLNVISILAVGLVQLLNLDGLGRTVHECNLSILSGAGLGQAIVNSGVDINQSYDVLRGSLGLVSVEYNAANYSQIVGSAALELVNARSQIVPLVAYANLILALGALGALNFARNDLNLSYNVVAGSGVVTVGVQSVVVLSDAFVNGLAVLELDGALVLEREVGRTNVGNLVYRTRNDYNAVSLAIAVVINELDGVSCNVCCQSVSLGVNV